MWFQEVEAGYVKWVNVGKPVQCQWKAIALPSSSWYRKAYGVVVHWRCWLVQAIPRHQAQVFFQDHTPRLPWLHRCNFQVSTVPHVPAEHENSPTIFIGFRSMQCCVRYIALSLTTPGAVWSSAVAFDVSSRPQEQSGHRQWDWRLLDPLSWTGASPRPSWRPLWPSTLNESSWALGLAERRKNHTSKSCSFVVFVESNCKLKRSRWGILLNTEKGQTWQQQCQHALWTFTWQGRTPIRLSRASSHDVTMTTCIRAIVTDWHCDVACFCETWLRPAMTNDS